MASQAITKQPPGGRPTTFYFAYGSNLGLKQMKRRCPNSRYIGRARLVNYRWQINERGYANVVEAEGHWVDGLVYEINPTDEAKLDINEGVPVAYTKENIEAEFWPAGDGESLNIDQKPYARKMLVYIDRERITDDQPKKEYIYRMNMGIKDALKVGMPTAYVDEVMRKFIPNVEDKSVESFAKQQALLFEDEI